MQTTESKSGDTLVVELEGHLDTVSSQPLEDRLVQLIEGGERQIVLDCGRLDYLNSSGLKAVLVTAKRLEPVGGKLVLCALTSNVHMIFEMIGFTRILTIVATRAEALSLMPEARAVA